MAAVTCELKYSGVALSAMLIAVSATEALLLALPLGGPLRAACMGYAFFQAARACRELLAAEALRLDERRGVEVRLHGHWQRGTLQDGSFVLPWLTVVRWRPEGAWFDRSVILLPDAASAEVLRKIRVILRFT